MNGRYIIGIALVILGVLFLFDRLEILFFGDFVSTWWPLSIMGIGIYEIARGRKQLFFGVIVFLIGAIFQAQNLELLPGNFWDAFWPLLLVLIGVWILSGKMKKSKQGNIIKEFNSDSESQYTAIFGASRETLENDDFKQCEITAVFGGVELDLRKCKIPSGFAQLEVNAVFGGAEIWIPQNWKIETNGLPIFGGLSNKTWPMPNDTDEIRPVLKINYLAIFGGVEIKN